MMLFSRKCQRHQEKLIKMLLNCFPPLCQGYFYFVCFKSSFFFIIICLFFGCPGLHGCSQAFSSCGAWGLLFVVVCRLLIEVPSLIVEHRSVVVSMGSAVPGHVGSSQTRDQTWVSCVGRWVPIQWTPREVLFYYFTSWVQDSEVK